MSAKRERTAVLKLAGVETSASVGLLLADPPQGRGGAKPRGKSPVRDTPRVEREKHRRFERVEPRVDMHYIVSHLLDAAADDDTEGTLIRVCAVLRDLMSWDEVTFWPAYGQTGVLSLARGTGISAQAVAVTTTGAQRVPVPLISRFAAVGHVFVTGKPAYLNDGAPGGAPGKNAPAANSGGPSSFVFPIRGTSELLGAIECLSAASRLPDTTRLEEAAAVGAILGLFIERQRGRAEPKLPVSDAEPAMEQLASVPFTGDAHQLDIAFEALAESVLIFDREGHILRVNAADRAMLGYDSGVSGFTTSLQERGRLLSLRDPLGQPITEDRSPFERILRGETLNGQQAVEARLRSLDGRDIEVIISGEPFVDVTGHLNGGVVVTRAVAAQRRSHERKLQYTNRRLREFLAIVAHELKTPITASKGYVQLAVKRMNRLESIAATEAPALVDSIQQMRKNLADAEQSAQRLARLAERLTDVAHIQANKLEMRVEAVDLGAIIHAKVREQRIASPARAIRYKVRPLRAVPTVVDPDRIGQVLLNYLANALKYSSEESVVEVTLELRDTEARVSVRDAGPGIAPAEQERIWKRFEQVGGTQQPRSATGLGLGLYISRAIVEAHGGHVGLESAIGQGSTFWFDVPLAPHSE